MYHYCYDVIGANMNYHINKHPQEDLVNKGFKWTKVSLFILPIVGFLDLIKS